MIGSLIADSGDWAAPWTGAIWRASWQGGLAILLVWGVCRLLPRMPANVRCWLWRLTYLKLLVALVWASSVNLPLLPAQSVSGVASATPVEAEWLIACGAELCQQLGVRRPPALLADNRARSRVSAPPPRSPA